MPPQQYGYPPQQFPVVNQPHAATDNPFAPPSAAPGPNLAPQGNPFAPPAQNQAFTPPHNQQLPQGSAPQVLQPQHGTVPSIQQQIPQGMPPQTQQPPQPTEPAASIPVPAHTQSASADIFGGLGDFGPDPPLETKGLEGFDFNPTPAKSEPPKETNLLSFGSTKPEPPKQNDLTFGANPEPQNQENIGSFGDFAEPTNNDGFGDFDAFADPKPKAQENFGAFGDFSEPKKDEFGDFGDFDTPSSPAPQADAFANFAESQTDAFGSFGESNTSQKADDGFGAFGDFAAPAQTDAFADFAAPENQDVGQAENQNIAPKADPMTDFMAAALKGSLTTKVMMQRSASPKTAQPKQQQNASVGRQLPAELDALAALVSGGTEEQTNDAIEDEFGGFGDGANNDEFGFGTFDEDSATKTQNNDEFGFGFDEDPTPASAGPIQKSENNDEFGFGFDEDPTPVSASPIQKSEPIDLLAEFGTYTSDTPSTSSTSSKTPSKEYFMKAFRKCAKKDPSMLSKKELKKFAKNKKVTAFLTDLGIDASDVKAVRKALDLDGDGKVGEADVSAFFEKNMSAPKKEEPLKGLGAFSDLLQKKEPSKEPEDFGGFGADDTFGGFDEPTNDFASKADDDFGFGDEEPKADDFGGFNDQTKTDDFGGFGDQSTSDGFEAFGDQSNTGGFDDFGDNSKPDEFGGFGDQSKADDFTFGDGEEEFSAQVPKGGDGDFGFDDGDDFAFDGPDKQDNAGDEFGFGFGGGSDAEPAEDATNPFESEQEMNPFADDSSNPFAGSEPMKPSDGPNPFELPINTASENPFEIPASDQPEKAEDTEDDNPFAGMEVADDDNSEAEQNETKKEEIEKEEPPPEEPAFVPEIDPFASIMGEAQIEEDPPLFVEPAVVPRPKNIEEAIKMLISQERFAEALQCKRHLQAENDLKQKQEDYEQAILLAAKDTSKLQEAMAINTEMVELKKEVRSPEEIAQWMDPTLKGDTKTYEELRNMAQDADSFDDKFPRAFAEIAGEDLSEALSLQNKALLFISKPSTINQDSWSKVIRFAQSTFAATAKKLNEIEELKPTAFKLEDSNQLRAYLKSVRQLYELVTSLMQLAKEMELTDYDQQFDQINHDYASCATFELPENILSILKLRQSSSTNLDFRLVDQIAAKCIQFG